MNGFEEYADKIESAAVSLRTISDNIKRATASLSITDAVAGRVAALHFRAKKVMKNYSSNMDKIYNLMIGMNIDQSDEDEPYGGPGLFDREGNAVAEKESAAGITEEAGLKEPGDDAESIGTHARVFGCADVVKALEPLMVHNSLYAEDVNDALFFDRNEMDPVYIEFNCFNGRNRVDYYFEDERFSPVLRNVVDAVDEQIGEMTFADAVQTLYEQCKLVADEETDEASEDESNIVGVPCE